MIPDNFLNRHVGPRENDIKEMLKDIGVDSLDKLVDEIVPQYIKLKKPLDLDKGMSEYEYFNHIKRIAGKNKVYKPSIIEATAAK